MRYTDASYFIHSVMAAHKDEKKLSEFHQSDVFPWRIPWVLETGLSPGLSSDLFFMVSIPLQSSVTPAQLSRAKPPHGNMVPQGPVFSFLIEGACFSETKPLFLVWINNQDYFGWHTHSPGQFSSHGKSSCVKAHTLTNWVKSNAVDQFSAWGKYKWCEAVITRRVLSGHGGLLS